MQLQQFQQRRRERIGQQPAIGTMVGTVVPFLGMRRGIMVFQHDRVNYQLRPDTPKTQEALLKLGYEPSIFKFKTLNDFEGNESIKQIRYNHYLQKLKLSLVDIAQARKDIIKYKQTLVNLNLIDKNDDNGQSKMSNLQHLQLKFADPETVNDMMEVYNRTMNDKQDSQYQSQMESEDMSVPVETYDPVEQLEYMLKREIEKYQRAQSQKSKELSNQIENDARTYKMIQQQQQQEERIRELRLKLEEQKKKKRLQLKKAVEEKQQKIKIKDQEFKKKQQEARQKMQDKLTKLKEKLQEEEEKKRQDAIMKEQRFKERKKQIDENINLKQKNQQEYMNKTYNEIKTQQKLHHDRQSSLLKSRSQKLAQIGKMQDEKRESISVQCQQETEANVSTLINKLVSKEQSLKQMEIQKKLENRKKEKLQKMKENKLNSIKQKIEESQNSKKEEMLAKFSKLDKNLIKLKEERKEQQQIKSEMARLKQNDLQESYQRQQRQKVMRYKRVIKESNDFKQKMEIWKLQEELVKKAQQELQRKQKLENNHLDESMLVVSQAMFASTKTKSLQQSFSQPFTTKNLNYVQSFLNKTGTSANFLSSGILPQINATQQQQSQQDQQSQQPQS